MHVSFALERSLTFAVPARSMLTPTQCFAGELKLPAEPERQPGECMEQQPGSGTHAATGRGVRKNTDHPLEVTVRSDAVGERHHSNPEHAAKRGTDRQPAENGPPPATATVECRRMVM
jgi:hypothetical protein